MKKSEMLGKIWEVLYKETDLEEEGLKTLSEQLLEVIEDNGMEPPYSTSTAHYCECGCKGRCELGKEWEEE